MSWTDTVDPMDSKPNLEASRSLGMVALDVASAAVLAAIGVNELRSVGDDIFYRSADAMGMVLVLAQTTPIVARRFAPVTVTMLICAAAATGLWLDYPGTNALLAVPLALYSVGASRTRRATLITSCVAVAILTPALISSPSESSSSAVLAAAIIAVGAFAGGGVRVRRLYAEALETEAARAEQQRRLEAREAVLEERTRIARELHDAIGHTVNVMVMQAGAGRMAATVDASKSVQALAAIEEVGRATLGDIDRLLGLLGDGDGAPRAPTPSIRELPAMVERLRRAGLDVAFDVSGDAAPVPAPVAEATYRIVQEALTNAMKYAPGATVQAAVRITPTELAIDVHDDGTRRSTQAPRRRRVGGGRGLIGMRERVRALDGDLRTGPRPGGGFEVVARLPINPRPEGNENTRA